MGMNVGDIVRVIGTSQTNRAGVGVNAEMKLAANRMYYGKIWAVQWNGKPKIHTVMLNRGISYVWHEEDLLLQPLLTWDQALDLQGHIEAFFGVRDNLRVEEIKIVDRVTQMQELMVFNAKPFEEIDYSKPPDYPKHNLNYIYPVIRVEDKLFKDKTREITDCCKYFGTNHSCQDIDVIIPQDWINFMGYSEEIVVKWIEFIKNIGLPSAPIYVGKGTRPDHRPFKLGSINHSFIQTNSYYYVNIPATEYPTLNYLMFLLVRYLYLHQYNNIPGLCLQLKNNTYLSNWTILMLVHSARYYDSTYGLTEMRILRDAFTIPILYSSENDPTNYFKKLITTTSVNNSFKYGEIKTSVGKALEDILANKRWADIEGWIASLPSQLKEIEPIVYEPPPTKRVRRDRGALPREDGGGFRIAEAPDPLHGWLNAHPIPGQGIGAEAPDHPEDEPYEEEEEFIDDDGEEIE